MPVGEEATGILITSSSSNSVATGKSAAAAVGQAEDSAQLQLLLPAFVRSHLREKFLPRQRLTLRRVEEAKSAQQRVLVVTLREGSDEEGDSGTCDGSCEDDDDDDEKVSGGIASAAAAASSSCYERTAAALGRGNNKVVVRIWNGTSRWWNLNENAGNSAACSDNEALRKMAASEIAGYRVARLALTSTAVGMCPPPGDGDGEGRILPEATSTIRIPDVLYSSLDDDSDEEAGRTVPHHPWAILEYVGEGSTLFSSSNHHYDSYWMDTMIKAREEFEFIEPHPRWGRVPAEDSLEYALAVLRQVILPIHRCCFLLHHRQQQLSGGSAAVSAFEGLSGYDGVTTDNDVRDSNQHALAVGYTYRSMLGLYERAHKLISDRLHSSRDDRDSFGESKLLSAAEILARAVQRLTKEAEDIPQSLRSLPPVLCHMDYQPQNLLFARRSDPANSHRSGGGSHREMTIASVLDWEEAAYADPRFDLLLLCRKVCANRQQAEIVWGAYGRELQLLRQRSPTSTKLELGPIEPWLKLETVHSLTTLLMQSMDLLGGGRSPWERKPDLWGKIEREFGRLKAMPGWEFCDIRNGLM